MEKSILITQCLQNDFVKPIDRYEPMPNALHVGYEEARRLLGERVEDSPVNRVIDWAYHTEENELKIIHIRDWHDDTDPKQKEHLSQFGKHCIKNSVGADFVFKEFIKYDRSHTILNASGLNDFIDTNLDELLSVHKNKKTKIGLMGVWTEAKITFLAYDIKTRYPDFEIMVCTALTASSSRNMHFIALEQMAEILGVQIVSSIADFTNFLTGTQPAISIRKNSRVGDARLNFSPPNYTVSDTDKILLQYLFRDTTEVNFHCLDGGFSGNVVLKARAKDIYGHSQSPSVVKIGKRELIAKERINFERIQEVLGNNAPSVVDFAELEDRGAIKYRYAAMLDNNEVRTFQKLYALSDDLQEIENILRIVFTQQLGKMYSAANHETLNLMQYYDFTDKYAVSIRQRVEHLTGHKAEGESLSLHGHNLPNVCYFYERDLKNLKETVPAPHYVSYIHGDLNGANILIDGQKNVWLIDFFHTHRGHILKDLIKFENDLLFIFMEIHSKKEFHEAVKLLNVLLNLEDLGVPLENFARKEDFTFPQIQKAFQTICILRSFYPELIQTDRSPYQYYVAIMRYAMHTMSFDESNEFQKQLALYTGAQASAKIKEFLQSSTKLRINFLKLPNSSSSQIGMTILPGRKDRDRDLEEDIQIIKENGVKAVLTMVTPAELEFYGVYNLEMKYREAGLDTLFLPVIDQGVPSYHELEEILGWMQEKLKKGEKILVHCVGGLGRTGTIVACYLIKFFSLSVEEAVKRVREV
ncbi:MAG: isochorismatase family protein, partial [Leptospiraceae bacterium]|nr:isochorismatase family protein [Leptospiraceae bacterium]